ncbi:MAG: hypothetical protein HY909_26480 [Deltaproteobacteria bacterium]|nr:hypothetical protein [Deltaproteobacteria bacterium]
MSLLARRRLAEEETRTRGGAYLRARITKGEDVMQRRLTAALALGLWSCGGGGGATDAGADTTAAQDTTAAPATGVADTGAQDTTAPQDTAPPLDTPPPTDAGLRPGNNDRAMTFGGRARTYILHVPMSYRPGVALPLVLAYHGGNGTARNFAGRGFSEEADRRGFLVAYPQGVGAPGEPTGTWNAMHCCGVAFTTQVDDVGFTRALVADIAGVVTVDRRRVYATGHSNGAMFSHRLAAEAPDLVAAFGVYAGTIGGRDSPMETMDRVPPSPATPVPALLIHGRLDTHVPYDGGHGPEAAGMRVDLPLSRSASFWVSADGCGATPMTAMAPGGAATRDSYPGCRAGSALQVVSLARGTHSWPTTAADNFDATGAITDFVLGFTHP